ncbi:MAG: DUF523 domain-containing protein [Clostridia bacterium]|nr:DUF523 domain-containing protein [Clostridia bacterium]
MAQPKYLISACLCGICSRYDGGSFDYPALRQLAEAGLAIPFCPEQAGGLSTPRKPCEIAGDRVMAADGTDCTAQYRLGAEEALAVCRKYGLAAAILKEGSPSCGSHRIRDGSHTGRKIPGMGITAALLAKEGVVLYTEEALPPEVAENNR